MSVDDAELVGRIAAGDAGALAELYRRHVASLHRIATSVGGPSDARAVVQDVFMTLWRDAAAFDPAKGTLPAWLATITRRRALNDRRGEGRRARREEDAGAEARGSGATMPDELLARAERRAALELAVARLPSSERAAIALAFAEELTHAEVAESLGVPLGTAKSRLRSALTRLRGTLAPLLAGGLLVAVVVAARRSSEERARADLDDRALRAVTSSDAADIRLRASGEMDASAHGHLRRRPRASLVVLTTSGLPPLEHGAYVGWLEVGGRWRRIGSVVVGAEGKGLVVAEDRAFEGLDAETTMRVEVTREASDAVRAPLGPAVLEGVP